MKNLLLLALGLCLFTSTASAKPNDLRYMKGFWTAISTASTSSYRGIDNIRFTVKKDGRIAGGTATFLVTNLERAEGVVTGHVYPEKPYRLNGQLGYLASRIVLTIRSAGGVTAKMKGILYVSPQTRTYGARVTSNGQFVSFYR